MPQTVTATLLGTYKSVAANAAVSNANTTTSLDVLTVVHRLPTTPDIVLPVLRTVGANTSGGAPNLAFRSANASQAIFDFPAGNGAGVVNGLFDIIFEFAHSLVR